MSETDLFDKWIKRLAAEVEAIDHCDPDRLTEKQRFAIAIIAGVPEPCAIGHDGERWIVYRKPAKSST